MLVIYIDSIASQLFDLSSLDGWNMSSFDWKFPDRPPFL